MRIAFMLLGDLDRVSGGFIYDRMLVERLRARGHAVEVVSLPWRSRARAVTANLRPLPPGLAAADVVIQDELCHAAVFARNRQLRRAGVPIVALVHNLGSVGPRGRGRSLARAVEHRYLRSVDGIVAVCESTLRDARAPLVRDVPVVVAPAGRDHLPPSRPDAAAVASRARSPGPLRVLSSAAVVRSKGLHRLIDAIARPGGPFELDVAGALDADRAQVRRVRALIERLGVGARVRLHGLLRGAPLWALYDRAHVLALPSDREAYPLAVVEALGFGLPVLVTDRGGASEVLGAGPQGQALPPDDVAAWSRALASLAADRARLEAAGLAALARYAALGTWDDVASRVEALCARAAVRR
ncbi:MAG TPA: glycosyltransferase family 4 protein [Polyangia bacterium]|nr:glycosyltransferase family 4 protein [Polyangia bacterium]